MGYIAELQIQWGVTPPSEWWAGEFGAVVQVTDFPGVSTAMSIVDLGASDDPIVLLIDAVALSATADRSGDPWSLVTFDLRLDDRDFVPESRRDKDQDPVAPAASAGSRERDWRVTATYSVQPADLPKLDPRPNSPTGGVRVDMEAALVTSEAHAGTAEAWRTLIEVDRDCRRVAERAGVPVRLLEWRITDDGIDERELWT